MRLRSFGSEGFGAIGKLCQEFFRVGRLLEADKSNVFQIGILHPGITFPSIPGKRSKRPQQNGIVTHKSFSYGFTVTGARPNLFAAPNPIDRSFESL